MLISGVRVIIAVLSYLSLNYCELHIAQLAMQILHKVFVLRKSQINIIIKIMQFNGFNNEFK